MLYYILLFVIEFYIYIHTYYFKYFRFSKFYPKALEIAFTSDDKVTVAKYTADIQCSQLFKGFASLEVLYVFWIFSLRQS